MASFRMHVSLGVATGILGIIAVVNLALAKEPSFLVMLFALAALGSVLPDMDSDSSIPFNVAFGSFAFVAAGLAFASIYQSTPQNWQLLIAATGGVAIFVWAVVGNIFKRFTRHRGMAHSLPAALLAGLATFFLASRLYFADDQSFLLAVALVAGFLGHLILDEIYAAVNFEGKFLIPNKAFGTALKLKSDSKLVNLLAYSAIIFLLVGNTQRLLNLAITFWTNIAG